MLSEEEKKAIDELKEEINNPVEVPTDKFNTFILYNIESARTILNLIEKQSKEIEEYKKQLDLDYVDKHFVPIERYNQLEKEIEELKEKNEYLPNWVSKKYVSKDKIKAKIEPRLKELDEQMKKEWKKYGNSREYQDMVDDYNFLQSLLEKE